MKKKLISLAVAGVLLAQVPLHAGEQSPAPTIPPLLQTLVSAVQELRGLADKQDNVAQSLGRYSSFQFSPGVRAQLKAVFGSEHPLDVKRAPAAKGLIGYAIALPEHVYLDTTGTAYTWAALAGKVSTNNAGTLLNTEIRWPALSGVGSSGGFAFQDIRIDSRQKRGAEGLWYGATSASLGVLSVRAITPGSSAPREQMRLEGLDFKGSAQRKGALISSSMDSTIKTVVGANGERIERIHLGLRLEDMPAQQMADFDQRVRNVQASELAADAQQEIIRRTLMDFSKSMVKSGASLVIDDISGAYHGYTASLKGRLSFDHVVDADFENGTAVVKKMALHLDLRVPVALVHDVLHKLAPNDKDAARNVVTKLTGDGFAVQEQDDLHAVIDVRNGKLTFNGKVVPIPGMQNGSVEDLHIQVH